MAMPIQQGAPRLSQHIVAAKKSLQGEQLFTKTFDAFIRTRLLDAEKIKERILTGRYHCSLFLNRDNSLQAMVAYDRTPFEYYRIENAFRLHFLHAEKTDPALEMELLAHVVEQAAQKKAKNLVFTQLDQESSLAPLIERYGFTCKIQPHEPVVHKVFFQSIVNLRERLSQPPPIQSAKFSKERSLVQAPYTSMTLMEKYIRLILNKQKTVEGRINIGAFGRVRVGDQFRFFSRNNGTVQVYCTVTEAKTFTSFADMLKHFSWRTCVPDARNEEHAISIYNNIPGYSEKARAHGVVGMKLQVDPIPIQQPESFPRKRPYEDRYGEEPVAKRARPNPPPEFCRTREMQERWLQDYEKRASQGNAPSSSYRS